MRRVCSILACYRRTVWPPLRWQASQGWDLAAKIGLKSRWLPQCMLKTIASGGYQDTDYRRNKLEKVEKEDRKRLDEKKQMKREVGE